LAFCHHLFNSLLNELQDSSVVSGIAQKLLDRLAAPFQVQDTQVYVSASIGITLFPHDGSRLEILLRNADQAMYAAIARVVTVTITSPRQCNSRSTRRAQLTKDLRSALEQGQLQVLFQPVAGAIEPDVFMPVAEKSGLIVPLGKQEFREATAGRVLSCCSTASKSALVGALTRRNTWLLLPS